MEEQQAVSTQAAVERLVVDIDAWLNYWSQVTGIGFEYSDPSVTESLRVNYGLCRKIAMVSLRQAYQTLLQSSDKGIEPTLQVALNTVHTFLVVVEAPYELIRRWPELRRDLLPQLNAEEVARRAYPFPKKYASDKYIYENIAANSLPELQELCRERSFPELSRQGYKNRSAMFAIYLNRNSYPAFSGEKPITKTMRDEYPMNDA